MIDASTPTHWYGATWWTAIAGAGQIVAAVFTAWAAVVAKRAAKAAEASVEVTKQTALAADISSRHRDRAYVALSDTKGPIVYVAGTPIDFTFSFKNVGATPAYKVRFGALLLIRDDAPSAELVDQSIEVSGNMGPLAPSIQVPVNCKGANQQGPIAFNQEGIDALRRRETSVVAAAKIVYEDAFGIEHETRVAYHFDPNVMGFRFAPYYNSMN